MRQRPEWWWLALWGVSVAVALTLRPLLPVDETRYLSVAWEMWLRHDWIVPYLNGRPYSDKPPLLFWGILLGWRVFGVNQWWPRLLPPLSALLCAFLLVRLARRLSSDEGADRALPFLSGLLWVTYSTLVLFDTLLTACVLLALAGIAEAALGRPSRGWVVCGAGIGLGVLAKGPVVLVHVLPVALLAPWWAGAPVRRGRWYLGLALALALGAAIGLSWAIVAGARGGPAYREALLWQQSAGRITHAFAHRRPWWWYLPLLPLVLFPWALWPPLWRSLARIARDPPRLATRFALSCLLPGLILLSLISGKQVHYLMPLLPAFAILAAAAIGTSGGGRQAIGLSLVTPGLLIVAHGAAAVLLARRYDLRPAAAIVRDAERAGSPVAFVGRYDGQLQFLGRLERPLEVVKRADLSGWVAGHPGGLVVDYRDGRVTIRRTPASSVPPSPPSRPETPAAGD